MDLIFTNIIKIAIIAGLTFLGIKITVGFVKFLVFCGVVIIGILFLLDSGYISV